MSRVQGAFEKSLIEVADNNGVQLDAVLKNLSYSNDLKLECVRLLQSKGLSVDEKSVFNCVDKFHQAGGVLESTMKIINH